MLLHQFKILLALSTLLISSKATSQNIFRTVCQGKVDRLDSLLVHESINVQDTRGRSLLHWAVGCNRKESFDHLIARGIDFKVEDNQYKTALHVAVNSGRKYFFRALDSLSGDDWVKDYGTSLLETGILTNSEFFVTRLIERGVNMEGKNSRGNTPLEIASRIPNNEMFELLLNLGADNSKIRTIVMRRPYMANTPVPTSPEVFAANFISTEQSEFGSVFNSDGTEFYFGVDVNGKSEIRYSRLVDNQWSTPEIIVSHPEFGYNDPFLSNDEKKLYFISGQSLDGKGDSKDIDIWYVEKTDRGWSKPINAGSNINSERNEYYISFTNEGTMYFSSNKNAPDDNRDNYDIYFSKESAGGFQAPVRLGDAINTDAYEADVFISPDETYIIFCSTREHGFGQGDLYISFKNIDGSWSDAVNMGPEINSANYEYCPFVSKDGEFLLYTSNQDIYWVSTQTIDDLQTNSGK